MSKKIGISEKMILVCRRGFRIYPKFDINHKFAVVIEDENNLIYKNKKTIGDYKHTSLTINKAIESALCSVYNKLVNFS